MRLFRLPPQSRWRRLPVFENYLEYPFKCSLKRHQQSYSHHPIRKPTARAMPCFRSGSARKLPLLSLLDYLLVGLPMFWLEGENLKQESGERKTSLEFSSARESESCQSVLFTSFTTALNRLSETLCSVWGIS